MAGAPCPWCAVPGMMSIKYNIIVSAWFLSSRLHSALCERACIALVPSVNSALSERAGGESNHPEEVFCKSVEGNQIMLARLASRQV